MMALSIGVALAVVASLTVPAPLARATDQERYRYPIVPGTAEWAAFSTHGQMVAASQLPTDVLGSMPTAVLVETVLDYPLFLDLYAFNTPQYGFDVMSSRFNGIPALFARQDAPAALLERYSAMQRQVDADPTQLTDSGRMMRVASIEMLLAQRVVLSALSRTDLNTLLLVVTDRLESVREFPEIYGPSGEESILLLGGRALYTLLNSDWESTDFLATGLAAGADALTDVEAAIAFRAVIPQPDELVRGDRDYASTVKTPNGTSVRVIAMTWELSSAKISEMNRYVEKTYPQATRETNASRRYNCHSYAWYSQSTSNTRWMNTPGDDTYWTDGSYRLWHYPLVAKYNTRASYVNGDHSALKTDKGGRIVQSKWGQYPRMRHDQWYSPYVDDRLDFYYRTGT